MVLLTFGLLFTSACAAVKTKPEVQEKVEKVVTSNTSQDWFWSKPDERLSIGFAVAGGYGSYIDSSNGNQLNDGLLGEVLSAEIHLTKGLSLRTGLSGGFFMSSTDSQGNAYSYPAIASIPILLKAYVNEGKWRRWVALGAELEAGGLTVTKTKSNPKPESVNDRVLIPAAEVGIERFSDNKMWSWDFGLHIPLWKAPMRGGANGKEEFDVLYIQAFVGGSFHFFPWL